MGHQECLLFMHNFACCPITKKSQSCLAREEQPQHGPSLKGSEHLSSSAVTLKTCSHVSNMSQFYHRPWATPLMLI